jgi:NAD(P)-dependent dehydrogenase (short-subunit alcohol dehydrogenase family)
VVHYRSSEAEARETAGEAAAAGVGAWAVRADLREEGAPAAQVDEARRQAGPLDILVNAASEFPRTGFATLAPEELERAVRLEAWAPLALARSFVGQVDAGHIVNFLDARVRGFDGGHAAYHAAKTLAALFTREMALRFAPRFQVNAVAPGLILPPPGEGPEVLERLRRSAPLERIGTPDDVTAAVLYLVRSRHVTGQVLFVDGGRHLRDGGGEGERPGGGA